MSTTVRKMVMSKFGGCRKWPYHGQSNRRTNVPHVNFPKCESLHTLVHPLWAASFWHNQNASYKNGVRLAHQNSHKVTISTCLLRWSYGLEPEVSPPAKINWQRGASRRRRRSIVRLPPNFFFRLTTLTKTTVALALITLMIMMLTMAMLTSMMTSTVQPKTAVAVVAPSTKVMVTMTNATIVTTSRISTTSTMVKSIDGSEQYDGSAGGGVDDQYDPNDASYIDGQHDDNQYDDRNDRNNS